MTEKKGAAKHMEKQCWESGQKDLGKPQKDTASTMRQSCMQKSGLWFYTDKYKSQVTVFEHN